MIKDFSTTVHEIAAGDGLPDGASFVPKLCETILAYSAEVFRDIELPEWSNQFQGGLNAGYILCLLGQTEQALAFLEKSISIHHSNRDQYSESESSVLEFVVSTLQEFAIHPDVIEPYQKRLALLREQERELPADLRLQIVHIEADLECAEGDIDQAYSVGRREQGLLYQRLGEHDTAIAYFRQALAEDRRDWRRETSVKNRLSIVDSQIARGDNDAALEEFLGLMDALEVGDAVVGQKLPELFTDNFNSLSPYLEKLDLADSFESIAHFAVARLKSIEPREHRDRREICTLTEILALHHVRRGEFQIASDLFDAGRDQLEYKHHLSRRDQAEFAILAGNPEKAEALIREDETDRGSSLHADEKVFELASLDLRLGNIARALERLDAYCEQYKRGLVSGTFSQIFETRRAQISILAGAIGSSYVQQTRENFRSHNGARLGTALRFLEGPDESVQ